jgi:hypothetical protein
MENPRLRAFPCLQFQRAPKEDTHLPRTFEFDHFPPILVDLDLFLYLDGLFAVSDCDQQKGADGYWNWIPLCRRPGIDELLWSKDNESHKSATGLEFRGENTNDGHFPLKKLFDSGDVPHISSEDRLWFTKKLCHFGYRGPELGSDSDFGSTVNLDGPGTDSDDSVYESDASSAISNYGL